MYSSREKSLIYLWEANNLCCPWTINGYQEKQNNSSSIWINSKSIQRLPFHYYNILISCLEFKEHCFIHWPLHAYCMCAHTCMGVFVQQKICYNHNIISYTPVAIRMPCLCVYAHTVCTGVRVCACSHNICRSQWGIVFPREYSTQPSSQCLKLERATA